eukprot:XP_011664778.1 PREDICTED: RNA-directed DNA polymerase from mobile element jockey-like [Strongylocentrotus purpuratus]
MQSSLGPWKEREYSETDMERYHDTWYLPITILSWEERKERWKEKTVSRGRPIPGQNGANMNNLRHLMDTSIGQSEVRSIIPQANENCSGINVIVNNQRHCQRERISIHANLVRIKTTERCHSQVAASQHRYLNLPSFYLCNARSLNNKLDEMEIILRERKTDIAAVTETWFRSDMPTHLAEITNYNLFTKSRLHRQGGGVALYVQEAYNPVQMKIEVPTELEVLWVKIRPERLPRAISHLIVAVVYHPPGSVLTDILIDHLQDTMDQILGQHPDAAIAIMGDFNQLDLTTLLANTNFKQAVKTPTRENRILDKIVTNFSGFYDQPLVCCPLGASDHNTVVWSPLAPPRYQNSIMKRITRPLRDSDKRLFGSWITRYEWSSVMDSISSDEQTEAFYAILNSQIDRFLPTKTVRMHCRDKKWITPVIKSLIKERQAAFSGGNKELTRKLANCVKKEIRKAKHDYYNDRVKKHKKANPAEWYKQIKIMTNMKNANSYITVPGVDRDDTAVIANRINDFFKSVAEDVPAMDAENLPAYLPDPSPPPRIQPWDVYQQLKKVKVGKAVGPDMIPSRIIKEFACELSIPLAHIFSTSLAEGVVPKMWKRAVVVPVPKTTPACIDKLRPISLTDSFAKVFEGFVSKWLMQYIGSQLDNKQFGNIKGLSTTHCLVDLLHCLYQHAEKSKAVSTLVMTDFRKAFDRIDHTIAIQKMISFGVKPTLIRWIADFLTERTQCVRYRGVTSEWVTMKAGVPQGTKLGPIVFLIVINNALRDSNIAYWKYVDDVTVVDTRFAGDQILKGHGLPIEDLCTIYTGFLRPLVEYASPVWNGGLTKEQKREEGEEGNEGACERIDGAGKREETEEERVHGNR